MRLFYGYAIRYMEAFTTQYESPLLIHI